MQGEIRTLRRGGEPGSQNARLVGFLRLACTDLILVAIARSQEESRLYHLVRFRSLHEFSGVRIVWYRQVAVIADCIFSYSSKNPKHKQRQGK